MSFSPPSHPFTHLGQKIESAIRKALYEYAIIEENQKIGVALSGGKDSLTLLFMMHALNNRGFPPFQLHAFHAYGQFSCGASIDTEYLGNICKQLEIPFTAVKQEKELKILSCYPCSRLRRTCLFKAAKQEGVNTLLFGHHRDDHAQTVLLNLLHRGEFAGNLPKVFMENYDITIARPLIYVAEQDIIQFARQNHFERVVCRCPVGQTSKRRVVENILKDLEEQFPHVRENLASAAHIWGSKKGLTP
jgi:tRNA 2-thiocytidine biosynthesis protein TtcA